MQPSTAYVFISDIYELSATHIHTPVGLGMSLEWYVNGGCVGVRPSMPDKKEK